MSVYSSSVNLFYFSLISDTRHSAESALNASNAYKAIVEAINDALNASGEAIKAANEARDLVRTNHTYIVGSTVTANNGKVCWLLKLTILLFAVDWSSTESQGIFDEERGT